MRTILDVNFGHEFFGVAWSPGKTRPKNSLSKFAIKIRWEIRRQFSSNSPDQNEKFTPNPLCITSGPRLEPCKNHDSRSNSRSDSRNCCEPTRKIFICPCILAASFQELGWSPRARKYPPKHPQDIPPKNFLVGLLFVPGPKVGDDSAGSVTHYLRWAKSPKSPIAGVQRTQSTLAIHSAVPRGTNVKRVNANRAIRIATQRTQGLWGLISVFWREIWTANERQRFESQR